MIDYRDLDIEDLILSTDITKKAKVIKNRVTYCYKLGETIANNVKFWGELKTIKGHTTAKCICPLCEKLWRVELYTVRKGTSKSCGCKRGKTT